MKRSLTFLTLGAMTLGFPLSTFAASARTSAASAATADNTSISTEDILNAVDPASEPVAVPMPIDGKGGGSMNSSIYYPGPQSGGVQVTADVTTSITPDYVAINAYCEIGKTATRQGVRDALNQLYIDIKNFVGKDGRVRKTGPISAYPFYDSTGVTTDAFNGTLNILVRVTNMKRAQAISDYIEEKNCSVNWDVRLVNTQQHELSILDDLATQLNARKAVFEKLLQKRLTLISGANLSTYVDGYGTYDPETNTADATSTLSVTFDLGGRATLPTAIPMTK